MPNITYQLPYRQGLLNLSTRTHIMGILNITPDSFSGGGMRIDPQRAVAQALQMVEEGADIIDFGGESTRPGAAPVAEDEELRRVMPVIEAVIGQITVATSIDTYKIQSGTRSPCCRR
jgi:dihydropteroate synthase